MRRLLFFSLCLIISFSSKAAFIVKNRSSCQIKFQIGVDRSGSCSSFNASVPTNLMPGATIIYPNPTFVTWMAATPTPTAGDVFTWLRVYPSTNSACTGAGNQVSGSCGPFTMGPVSMTVYDASCTTCGSISIEWTIVGSDIVVEIL